MDLRRSTRRHGLGGDHNDAGNAAMDTHYSGAAAPSMPQAGSVALPPVFPHKKQLEPQRRLPHLSVCEGDTRHEIEEGTGLPARFAFLGKVAPYPAEDQASYVIDGKPDKGTSFEEAFVDDLSSGFLVVPAFPPLPQKTRKTQAAADSLEMIRDQHQLKEAVDMILRMSRDNYEELCELEKQSGADAASAATSYDEQLRSQQRRSEEGGTSVPHNLFSDAVVKSRFCRSTDGAWIGGAVPKPDMKKGVPLTRSGLTYGVDMRYPTADSELPETVEPLGWNPEPRIPKFPNLGANSLR